MDNSENELAAGHRKPAQDATAGAILGKAVTYTGRGGYDVIRIAERNVKAPEASEVRFTAVAAAVNPTDVLLRARALKTWIFL
jgi:hypothetical protein